jgi:DNA polymerase-3 subunit delta
MGETDLMREVGVPSWKLPTLRDQSRGWDEGGLARAIRLTANADAEIEDRAHVAAYALGKLVLEIVKFRPSGKA